MSDRAPIPREAWPADFRPFEDNSTAEERAKWARLYDAKRARVAKLRRDERDLQNGQRRNASATPSPTPSPLRPEGDSVPVPTPLGGTESDTPSLSPSPSPVGSLVRSPKLRSEKRRKRRLSSAA